MSAEQKSKGSSRGRFNLHLWRRATILITIVLILVITFAPNFISSKYGNSLLIFQLEKAIGAEIEFDKLSYGWKSGLQITNLSVVDSANKLDLFVENLTSKPSLTAMLSGKIVVLETFIKNADIEITVSKNQILSVADKKLLQADLAGFHNSLEFSQLNVSVSNTRLKINLEENAQQIASLDLREIELFFDLKPKTNRSEIKFCAVVGEEKLGSEINLDGEFIIPAEKWQFENSNAKFDVSVKSLNLELLAPLFAIANIELNLKGLVSSQISSELVNGEIEKMNISTNANNFLVAGDYLGGDEFSVNSLEIESEVFSKGSIFTIANFVVSGDWFDINASGEIPSDLRSLKGVLSGESQNIIQGEFDVELAQLTNQLSNTIGLPENVKVEKGRFVGSAEKGLSKNGRSELLINGKLESLGIVYGDKEVQIQDDCTIATSVFIGENENPLCAGNLKTGFCGLNFSGDFNKFEYSVMFDIAKTTGALSPFVSFGDASYKGGFATSGNLNLGEKVSFTGNGNLANFVIVDSFGEMQIKKTLIGYNLELADSDAVTKIKELSLQNTDGKITAKNINLAAQAKNSCTGNISCDYNLAKLCQQLHLLQKIPPGLSLFGELRSDFDFDFSDDILRIDTNELRVDEFAFVSGDAKPFAQEYIIADTLATFDLKKQVFEADIKIESPDFIINDANISKTINGDFIELEAVVNAQYDLAQISPLINEFVPDELEISGLRDDTYNLRSVYPILAPEEMIPNMDASISVGFESANYMGLRFGKTDLEITVSQGILRVAPFSSIVNNGIVNFAAVSKLDSSPRMMEIPSPLKVIENVELNKEATEKMLKYVNPLFADALEAAGVISLSCDELAIPLSDSGKNDAQIIGVISLDNVFLSSHGFFGELAKFIGVSKEQPIRIRPTYFTLQNGVLSYKDMQVDFGNNPVNFRGSIYLDDRIDMEIVLPYTYGGKTVRIGQDSDDRIVLPIQGDLENPKIDFSNIIQDTAKDLLERELKRQLKKLFE